MSQKAEKVTFEKVNDMNKTIEERQKNLLITLWRSVPGTTKRIGPIPEQELQNKYWPAFLKACEGGHCNGIITSFIEVQYNHAFPWKRTIYRPDGVKWFYTFTGAMFALELAKDMKKSQYDTWEARQAHVEEGLKTEVFDEWTGELQKLFMKEAELYQKPTEVLMDREGSKNII